MKKERFTVGARGSALSRAQTEGTLDFLRARFPGTDYSVVTVETPGDRDLVTPIEKSAPDFFTRDLDEAVRDGRIDFAVHSAKDLPQEIAEDLDWFWLPKRADPRDNRKRTLTSIRFIREDKTLRFLWFSDARPSSLLEFDRVTVSFPGKKVVDPVWVDMITGRVFEIPAESVKYENDATVLSNIPMWDSPVMITDRLSVPLRSE